MPVARGILIKKENFNIRFAKLSIFYNSFNRSILMKKIILTTLIMFAILWTSNAQNGGGCQKAISISPGIYVSDSMIVGAATFDSIYPNPNRAIWYKFTPSQDGLMNISSCGGGSDTRLFIYSGSCNALDLFGYNDDYCAKNASGEETASDISKFVKAGKTYYFEWDSAWDSIRFGFSLSFSSTHVPTSMQACQSAKVINAGTTMVDSIIGFATHGDAGHSNWYKFTPTKNGKLSISACGIDADTRLWVYKGACNALVSVAESDDECDGATIREIAVAISDLSVIANTAYYLEWDDSWENVPFEFNLTFDAASGLNDEGLSKNITLAPNPANDFLEVHFNLEKMGNLDLTIINTIGQAVLSKKTASILRGVEKLDVSALNSGIYILQISDGTKRTNKKVLINR